MMLIITEIKRISNVPSHLPAPALEAPVCGEGALAANLTWRVHRTRYKESRTAMIEFALDPVVPLLFCEPVRGNRIGPKSSATTK